MGIPFYCYDHFGDLAISLLITLNIMPFSIFLDDQRNERSQRNNSIVI